MDHRGRRYINCTDDSRFPLLINRSRAVILVALLLAVAFVVYRKAASRREGDAYKLLEHGEGGAVGDAGFSKKFEQVLPQELKIGPRIGKGSFAEVFKARWRGTLVAVKRLPAHSLTPEFFEDFEREAALMKRLRHPNVLLYLGAAMIPFQLVFSQLKLFNRSVHDSARHMHPNRVYG